MGRHPGILANPINYPTDHFFEFLINCLTYLSRSDEIFFPFYFRYGSFEDMMNTNRNKFRINNHIIRRRTYLKKLFEILNFLAVEIEDRVSCF